MSDKVIGRMCAVGEWLVALMCVAVIGLVVRPMAYPFNIVGSIGFTLMAALAAGVGAWIWQDASSE